MCDDERVNPTPELSEVVRDLSADPRGRVSSRIVETVGLSVESALDLRAGIIAHDRGRRFIKKDRRRWRRVSR